MKIYSIKEIVQATNDIYNSKSKASTKKLSIENENLIKEVEKNTTLHNNNQNEEKILVLKNEISTSNYSKIDQPNYKIQIKSEVKDHMINELYLYLKKKVRKNTLKIIIDEQLEIKNLKNEINFLKKIQYELTNNFKILKNNYESTLEINNELKSNNKILQNDLSEVTKTNETLDIENNELKNNELKLNLNNQSILEVNKELKNNNKILQNNLDKVTDSKESLDKENKKLKDNYESTLKISEELKTNNKSLQNNLNEVSESKETLDRKNNKLKIKLKEIKKNLKDTLEKNRSFEINIEEIKNTLSRYISNYKKLQEKLNSVKDSKNLKLEKELQKVKFYQDENIRLSSELLSMQKRNNIFKENFRNIELEKEKISSKIKDLNKSIEEKTNIISSPLIKSSSEEAKKDITKLNDKEQKSLDEAINRIFAKV